MDTGSKGAIVGVTAATTVSDIYRACMEGVVYEMMLNMECLEDAGLQMKRLNATGAAQNQKSGCR